MLRDKIKFLLGDTRDNRKDRFVWQPEDIEHLDPENEFPSEESGGISPKIKEIGWTRPKHLSSRSRKKLQFLSPEDLGRIEKDYPCRT